jgi:hypothetical protein
MTLHPSSSGGAGVGGGKFFGSFFQKRTFFLAFADLH